MSDKKQERTPEIMGKELLENIKYAITAVTTGLAALKESKIADDFKGNIPSIIELDAVPLAMWELFESGTENLDREKLVRGLVAVCLVFRKNTIDSAGDVLTDAMNIINGGK